MAISKIGSLIVASCNVLGVISLKFIEKNWNGRKKVHQFLKGNLPKTGNHEKRWKLAPL